MRCPVARPIPCISRESKRGSRVSADRQRYSKLSGVHHGNASAGGDGIMAHAWLDVRFRCVDSSGVRLRGSVSSASKTLSTITFWVRRQNIVSVESKRPVSPSLLDGAPPRQKSKYLRLARQARTPRSISAWSTANAALLGGKSFWRILPRLKSPKR